MIKVGDHIEIKKPKLEAEETFNDVLSALRSNKLKINDKLTWCETAINLLEMWYLRDERGACLAAKNRLIPILHNLVEKSNINLMGDFFEYYRRTYAFAARRDFESFIDYMEWDQPRKVYANRRFILKPYVDALQELTYNPNLKYVVASFPPSMGKCIEENTPVYTPKGLIPIKDINIGDEVYSMKDKEICVEKVTNKWNTKKKQIRITLKSNKTITISPEHRMLTFDGYKQGKNITKGDYLYSILTKKEQNKPIDDDELLFITCMIFEGHCKSAGMSYTGEDNEITHEFIKVCEKFNIPYKKDTKKNNSASSYRLLQGDNSNNVKLLKKYGIYGHLCYTKRLPQCFYTMPLVQRYKFIGIMFATDGYINKLNAGITLANEGLIDDIQFLLNTCGIYSRKREKHCKKYVSWELVIPKDIMLELRDKIYCYQKQKTLYKLPINQISKRGNLSIKYPKQIFRGLKPTGTRGGYAEELHIERDIDRTLPQFEKFVTHYPKLEEYRYKDFYWEEILKVEYINEETNMVDIEVSNTHNFIANGYVSHNSYIATLWSAWAFGLSIDNSIIRLSYSEELVLGFSRTVKGYLCSNSFSDVFSRYKLFNNKPFDVERESDWKIKNANVPKSNLISRTRMGSTTGERANFAIIFDDMTKGAEEANSDSTHRLIYDKWNTEWWNRRDGERCKFLFIGTQWTPEDILNRIIDDRNKVDELRETENPYVMRNKDTIVIRVPLLDNEGKTTCEEVYPQDVAEQIKETTDPFLFSCVYQQSPIAPTGREMAWENLTTYIDPPEELEPYCMAVMDTKRKGKDNLNMFICKPDGKGRHYLWDCLFTKKPMDEMYDDIVYKIINNNITTLVIENNIDVSLKPLLEGKLKDLGKENLCKIIELYNTKKKEERIKNNLGGIQRNIIFKDKSIVKPNTDIGRLMDNITKYSFDYPNKFDDGPDGAAMYNSEIIVGRSILSKPQAVRRIF